MQNKIIKKDAIVVGAGFAGIYLAYRFGNRNLNFTVIEAGNDVGGTWFWNRYPGAKCDVQSLEYSYSFSKEVSNEWSWSQKYASQPEILRYTQFVTKKFDLKKHMQFNTRVTDAIYDEDRQLWQVKTDTGEVFETPYFIMATGCLSVPRTPNFKGMDTFKGELFHTGNWPHEPVSFEGKKVGVIGTGSSGIQSIPVIAETAEKTIVFVKDSNYTVPANNQPLKESFIKEIKAEYDRIRELQRQSFGGGVLAYTDEAFEKVTINEPEAKSMSEFDKKELFALLDKKYINAGLGIVLAFGDLAFNEKSDAVFREYLDTRIRKIVKDKEKAELLIPKSKRFYDRRPVLDTNFYETFNKETVDLVDVNDNPIEMFTEKGIQTAQSTYDLDMIVCATGFDAMTGAINKVNIVGKNGISLKDYWKDGPRMYLGLMANGFPNFFAVTGPGSPSVLSNMIVSIEQHVEWIDDCIKHLQENNQKSIEANLEAENDWVNHGIEIAKPLFITQGNSWYVGANVPGKPRVIMPYVGGVGAYREKCNEVVKNGYEGFAIA